MIAAAVAALLAGGGVDAAPIDGSPVRAVVERQGPLVHVRVIGRSRTPVQVRYTLVTRAGGNTASQGGSARLDGDVPRVLLDLTQSAANEPGTGLLRVTVGSQVYQQALTL